MWLLAFLFSSTTVFAKIELPTSFNSPAERQQTLGILGLGTSSKLLSAPYPLGGYAGFEFGAGVELIDASDINSLGSWTVPRSTQSTVTYPRFSFGKGFYNDFDLFFNFTPYSESTGISEYGGILRWSAYQSTYLPTNISILLHSNATNIAEKIFSSSVGVDITAGFTLKYVSLYFGGGQIESRGRFFNFNIIDGSAEQYETVSSIHTMMGGVLDFKSFFIAAQIDRYADAIFSVKLGVKR